MNDPLCTHAVVAIHVDPSGRVQLATEGEAGETIRRECATESGAALKATALIGAAIKAAAQQLANGSYDAVVITLQIRRRELTLEELSAKLEGLQ